MFCTLNGTHSLLANIRLISSAPSPMVAPECTLHLRCFNLLSAICGNFSFKMGTLKEQSIIKSTTFSRKTETSLIAQSPPFQQGLIIFLPHIAFESNQISKRLKSSVSKFYPIVNLKVIFLNSCLIKSLFSHKDRFQTSEVVYKASCWDWCHSYTAKTKRRLQEKVNSLEPWPNKNTHQLLLITSKPWDNVKWDYFQIIGSRKSDKVKEAMFIQELNPTLTAYLTGNKLSLYCHCYFKSHQISRYFYCIYNEIVFQKRNGYVCKCTLEHTKRQVELFDVHCFTMIITA